MLQHVVAHLGGAALGTRIRTLSYCQHIVITHQLVYAPGIPDTLKQDAWGAVKAAAEILSIAASMTQNVPYLGVVSSVLSEFLKIKSVRLHETLDIMLILTLWQEVESYKSEWNEVMSIASQIKGVIDQVLEQCGSLTGGRTLPPALKEPLEVLERRVMGSFTRSHQR